MWAYEFLRAEATQFVQLKEKERINALDFLSTKGSHN